MENFDSALNGLINTSNTSTCNKSLSVGKEMVNRTFALGHQLYENRFSPGILCINI